MLTEFGQMLDRELSERIKTETDFLVRDRATSFEDYRRRCGLIAGYTKALEYAREIDRKMMGEHEENA